MSDRPPDPAEPTGTDSAQSPELRPPEDAWPVSWEEHELAQHRRLAALPFALKLQWLEETHRLILAIQKSREAGRG